MQSTQGVRQVNAVAPELLAKTVDCLADDFDIAAVHIGMLASGAIAIAVADVLKKEKLRNVVLDPVLKSSSGADLLDRKGH